MPVAGPTGWSARVLAHAARGIAGVGALEEAADPSPVLLRWLVRATAGIRDKILQQPSFHTIGDVLEALTSLVPRSTALRDAVLELVVVTRRFARDLDSGLIDFDRTLRRVLGRLDEPGELFARAVKLGLPRVDPWV